MYATQNKLSTGGYGTQAWKIYMVYMYAQIETDMFEQVRQVDLL